MALDLSRVARLESVDRSKIERVGDKLVVQYRGEILPLIDLEGALPERRSRRRTEEPDAATEATVIICTLQGRSCGLLVHRILDILDADLSEATSGSRDGITACAVIDGRVNEIIDLEKLVERADPGFFTQQVEAGDSP
jgi:two-component system chemotaxis sensor kinase CheA